MANADIKVLLKIGDDWKRLTEEVILMNDRNIILYEKIFVRDTLIASQKKAIAGYENVVTGYQQSEANLIQQRLNLQKEIKIITKRARRNNTKTFIASFAAIAASVLYFLK
ncbi:MAG: hypothetical protein M9898_02285 [Chitinophagaceae bacterium]|nr:hypothetical protein [Chitinophagaceae bacterium]